MRHLALEELDLREALSSVGPSFSPYRHHHELLKKYWSSNLLVTLGHRGFMLGNVLILYCLLSLLKEASLAAKRNHATVSTTSTRSTAGL